MTHQVPAGRGSNSGECQSLVPERLGAALGQIPAARLEHEPCHVGRHVFRYRHKRNVVCRAARLAAGRSDPLTDSPQIGLDSLADHVILGSEGAGCHH